MTLLLIILYPFAVQHSRGFWWWLILSVTLILPLAVFLDHVLNYTELALLTWDFPKPGETSFSKRMVRLQYQSQRFGLLANLIDTFAPSGIYIDMGSGYTLPDDTFNPSL